MHPLHTHVVAGLYDELRRDDLLSDAERARRANGAGPSRPIAAISRAAARWGVAVRVLRGGRREAPTSPAAV